MIVGVGVDIVDVGRFGRSLERTPSLRTRLFDEVERSVRGEPRGAASLAARFAAKEALIKVVGDTAGFRWHDMRVRSDEHGSPFFEVVGGVREALEQRGVTSLHLSLSHDAGAAIAFVVAEAGEQGPLP